MVDKSYFCMSLKSRHGVHVNCDYHISPFDLHFSTRLTKFDAVKGSNRTYTWPLESVEFWWVSDLIYGVKIDVEAEFGLHYTNTI